MSVIFIKCILRHNLLSKKLLALYSVWKLSRKHVRRIRNWQWWGWALSAWGREGGVKSNQCFLIKPTFRNFIESLQYTVMQLHHLFIIIVNIVASVAFSVRVTRSRVNGMPSVDTLSHLKSLVNISVIFSGQN